MRELGRMMVFRRERRLQRWRSFVAGCTAGRLPLRLGRLPGDIAYQRENTAHSISHCDVYSAKCGSHTGLVLVQWLRNEAI